MYEKQLVKIGTGDITDIKDKTSQILLLSYTSLPKSPLKTPRFYRYSR